MIQKFMGIAMALFIAQANAAEGVFPLATIAPDGPISELAPLAPLAENARIVGIGEISHGTTNDTSR